MIKDISILIALFEEEKKKLEQLIKECIEDIEGPDYTSAYHHQKAIAKTAQTIHLLERFQGKSKHEPHLNEQLLSEIKKRLPTADFDLMISVLKLQVPQFNENPDSLKDQTTSESDTGLLDNILLDILSGKINKFKLIFNRTENIFLLFSRKSNYIQITSSSITEDDIGISDLKLLTALGFNPDTKNKYELKLQNDANTFFRLKSLLLKIVFDVYYFRHPAAENFIQLY